MVSSNARIPLQFFHDLSQLLMLFKILKLSNGHSIFGHENFSPESFWTQKFTDFRYITYARA